MAKKLQSTAQSTTQSTAQSSIGGRLGLTESERQVYPIFQQEMEEEKERRNLWQPVQMVFDLLQRGQYFSANIVNEITESIQQDRPLAESVQKTIESAWQGITGEEKGSYTDVLENIGIGDDRVFENAPEGTRREQMTWADVLGFAGDVLLDPVTYFTFGSSKVAFKAAKKYADDAVEVARKELSQGGGRKLQKLAREQFDPEKFNKLLKQSEEKARKYAQKMGADVSRYLNETYKQSFRDALRKPAQELREDMAVRIDEIVKGQGKGAQGELFEETTTKGLIDDISERLPAAYEGAGERRLGSFFGAEFGKSVRDPNFVSRSLSIVREQLGKAGKETAVGAKLSDGWWSFMNNSAVGRMRKRLGFRNPYQKSLRIKELQEGQEAYLRTQYITNIKKATGRFDEETKQAFVRVNDAAEEIGPHATPFEILDDPEALQRLGLENVDTENVSQLAEEVRGITKQWDEEYNALVKEGIVESKGTIANYLPAVIKEPGMSRRAAKEIGSRQPGFAKVRGATREQITKAEVGSWARIFGLSKEQADDMVRKYNLSDVEMDLDQLLAARAVSQAKAMKRGNIVRSLREFSIPKAALGGDVSDSTLRMLGLTEVPDQKTFRGLLFDADTAEILTRASEATDPNNINPMMKMLGSYTQWWKGIVTLTTGFHSRNFISNQVTGFLKHGAKWFDIKTDRDALVTMIYSKWKNDPGAILKKIDMDEGVYNRVLNHRYGAYTLRELADEQSRKGLISESVHGWGPEDLRGKKSANPLSSRFKLFDISRDMGFIVENHSKMKSFLIDYSRTMRGVDASDMKKFMTKSDEAEQYARDEAKRWWIDYEDLTETERKVRRYGVPFYCVPDDVEILTRNGWEYYNEITPHATEVLAYDIETDQAFWKQLKGVAVFDYDGMLMSLKNRTNGEFLFTPDHKWPVFVQENYKSGINRKIAKGYELQSGYKIPLAAETVNLDQQSPFTVREAKILGWILTDGTIRHASKNSYEYIIYQSKDPYVDELRELLGDEANEYIQKRPKSTHKDLHYFAIRGDLHKRLQSVLTNKTEAPQLVTEMNAECAVAMWDAMYAGDGTIVKDRTDRPGIKTDQFFAAARHTETGKAVGDAFQILSIMLGKVAHMSKDGRGMYIRASKQKRFMGVGKDRAALGTEWYKGKIWCPEIDGLCWMMRRNGKHIWTSNTWIRRNLSNQIASIYTFPEMMSMFPKLEGLLQYEDPDYDPEMIPDWMKQLGMFPVSEMESGELQMFWPNFPYQDLNLIPLMFEEGEITPRFDFGEAKQEIVNSTHPFIRAAASSMTDKGYDFFYRRDLEGTGPAPYIFRLFLSKPQTMTALDGFLRLVGKEDGLEMHIDQNGKLQMDARMAHTIEQFLPVLRHFEYWVYGGQQISEMFGSKAIEEAIESFTGAQDEYEGAEQAMQTMSYYLGVKTKPLDVAEAKKQIARDVYFRSLDRRSERRDRLPGSEARKRQYVQNVDRRVARLR